MCFVLGWQVAEPLEPWLVLRTAQEAKEFLEGNLLRLQLPLEAAASLMTDRPSRIMQIQCSQYHDSNELAVLMGDAAHSTSPFIGQGCDTALPAAATLASLLLETTDATDLPRVLHTYSALQIPEGHTLVDHSESQAPMKVSLAV